MTDRSERIAAAHLGARRAEPASETRLRMLTANGLSFQHVIGGDYLVEGEFYFNAFVGSWRHTDDEDLRGYTVPGLKQQITLRKNREAARGAVAAGLGLSEFADGLPLAPESLPIGAGIRQPERDDTQPRQQSSVVGEARSASNETGTGANVGKQTPDASGGEAAVSLRQTAGSRDLLPGVAP